MDAGINRNYSLAKSSLALFELALILIAIALFTITETYEPYVTLGLGLLAIFFAERGIRGHLISTRNGLEFPIVLFIISAGIATVISYNQSAALLQFARILGAAALFFVLADSQSPIPELLGLGYLLAAAFLAIYWPLKNDFTAFPGKLEIITSIGVWLNSRLPPLPGPDIHPNVAAGALLVGIPIGTALSWQSLKAKRMILSVVFAFFTIIVLFGLVMTSSRGAIIGLGAATIATGLEIFQRKVFSDKYAKTLFWSAILVLLISGLGATLIGNKLGQLVGQIPDPSGSMRSRLDLWQDSLALVRDYIFTGSGLQTYWMVYSIYGILIHTPFIAHSHNSFLQVWIEQGLLGVLAVVWGAAVLVTWVWKAIDQNNVPPLGWAGLAALFAASVHGIVDVVFYVERTLPIIGLLLGFAALTKVELLKNNASFQLWRRPVWALPAVIGVSLVGGLIFRHALASFWYANLGSISQTKAELIEYDPEHFDNPTLDKIRQNLDLSTAQADFENSIAFQADNLTSLQRLSEIALSRGDYSQALGWMKTVWDAGHRDPVTRLLYGDALVASGNIETAAQILQGLTWAESRLMGQAFYRYLRNQDYERSSNAWETVLLLNPENAAAKSELSKIQNLVNP
jgi:O-antigen ligase